MRILTAHWPKGGFGPDRTETVVGISLKLVAEPLELLPEKEKTRQGLAGKPVHGLFSDFRPGSAVGNA